MEERDIIFKIGTKVKLRDYLKVGSYYGGVKFEDFCKQDFGKVLTITKVTPCNGYISTTKYEFEETPLEYTVEMLEPIKEKTIKYKAGDKVRIKKDLKAQRYGIEFVVDEMLKYAGRPATITKVVECDEGIKYSIDISGWNWTEEMFEPIADNGFKIGDKVIMNPERSKIVGVLTITGTVKDNPTFYKLSDNNGRPVGDWLAKSIIKVPLFKVGDIVQFHNIKEDKWYSAACMDNLESKYGIITKVRENRYVADKQRQDGCTYEVKDLQYGEEWCVTSASLELVPTTSELEDVTSVTQDKGLTTDIGITTTTAEAIAQAVDNVKGPQFKIGDRVLVREGLIPGKKYEEWDYNPEDGMGGWEFAVAMAKYMGKVATITGYVADDPNYCHLDIDKGTYSWIVNSLLPYTPGSDYDIDKQSFRQINKYFPTNKQQTKQNYENRLQEKGPVIAGRERQSGCAVRYPGEQIRVGISNLGYRKVTCKR